MQTTPDGDSYAPGRLPGHSGMDQGGPSIDRDRRNPNVQIA